MSGSELPPQGAHLLHGKPPRWQLPCWALVYLLVAGLLQFYVVSTPFDADTAYHAAVGRLIREHGILHAFPWTPFSWLADHYADKELLFHLLFVPFIGMGWITAAKTVGTILGALVLFVLYLILRAERVRFAGVWALLPLVASDVFVFRFALVRPHLLSLSLALLLLWAAARGRFVLLAVVAALYPWSYVAFWQLPLILLCAALAARFLSERRVEWRPAAVALGGILLGWALHPNSLNLWKFNWIHMVDVLFKNAWQTKEGIELGVEFLPFTPGQWARWLAGCVAMVGTGLVVGWRERRSDPLLLAFAFAAVVFGILTVRTARFAEYFVPFAAATMALATRRVPWRWTVPAVFAAALLYTAVPLSETLQGLGTKSERIPPPLASWLQQQIPAGAQVFTTEWGHTGTLMLALPDRRFIVALDPTLFLVQNEALYRLWYDLPRHPRAGLAEVIRQKFGARYVVSFWDDRFSKFYYTLASEPGVRTLLVSDMWMVYDLGGETR
jgi:hypothetical protein